VDTLGFAGNEALVSGNIPNLPSFNYRTFFLCKKNTRVSIEIVRPSSLVQCKQLNQPTMIP
jgi:hypothetical protein